MNRPSIKAWVSVFTLALLSAPQMTLAEDTQRFEFGAFQWPETHPDALPDARLHDLTALARNEAAKAQDIANRAEKLAADIAKSLNWKETPIETVSEGVQFAGKKAPKTHEEIYYGQMHYHYGSKVIGRFDFVSFPEQSTWGYGVATSADFSPMKTFKGQIWRPAELQAAPTLGVAAFKNGDQFSGLYYGGSNEVVGVYKDASGSRLFVGKLEMIDRVLQPKSGIVKDETGRLLVVVR